MWGSYKALSQQTYEIAEFKIVPIQFDDRFTIMQWRNEQQDSLRTEEILTKEKQDAYFENVIAKQFYEENPSQILFSFLQNEILIGYGGLVHIDWKNSHSEISFLLATKKNDEKTYESYFLVFLNLIKKVATNLHLKKIFTNGYTNRPYAFTALPLAGFTKEAELVNHIKINSQFYNIIYYSCIFDNV